MVNFNSKTTVYNEDSRYDDVMAVTIYDIMQILL